MSICSYFLPPDRALRDPRPAGKSCHQITKAGPRARITVMMIRNARLSCIILLTFPSLLLAQANNERKTVQAKGVLNAVARDVIQVVNEEGEQWFVKVDPKSKNVFQGSADVRFLRPGMLVEFRSSFDKKGKAQSAVRTLKVFSRREDTKLGLKPVSGGAAASGLFTSSGEEEDKKKKTQQPAALPFVVVGLIQKIKDNKLTVVAGSVHVQVELADKVQIAFSFTDFRYARKGDSVVVSGWAYPDRANYVVARSLTITAAKRLGADDEKSKKKASQVPDLNSLDDF